LAELEDVLLAPVVAKEKNPINEKIIGSESMKEKQSKVVTKEKLKEAPKQNEESSLIVAPPCASKGQAKGILGYFRS
jgi:hypothetical protein